MLPSDAENIEYVHDAYVGAFRVGECFTRREICEANGIPYSTVVYNLESAVKCGKLNKAKLVVKSQPTWVYALPETMPRLDGVK